MVRFRPADAPPRCLPMKPEVQGRWQASDMRINISGETELRYPLVSYDYNQHMNGSDLCQQAWNYFTTTKHQYFRNWWPLL